MTKLLENSQQKEKTSIQRYITIHIYTLHNTFLFLPQLVYRWRERGTMGRRRGASVLYVQREFEHVFHLNICTWNSNVANLHKMFSTTITLKNFISFTVTTFTGNEIFFFKDFLLFKFSNMIHFFLFFYYIKRCNRYLICCNKYLSSKAILVI